MAQQQFNQIQHLNDHQQAMKLSKAGDKEKRHKFHLNDHIDILIEILKRLDGRSLSVAACVCRFWCTIARNDSLWENLCFRHVSPPPSGVRPVVVALGGYRRLYMVCVRPVLIRLGELRLVGESGRRAWSREEVQLSLSLFCVDYYERLGVGERFGEASPSSLMFLCRPVNV
ncbi:F-box protein SNE-like isoform X1 [Tripterygium wilfordii]|uniref:F-box protein SNE-like isoform X1 n=1 Tax=Tripterygium wilfordii TaxID=458696 RepID=UPI0018F83772|nr:F-box protein SNE-like isoform X1 [Tripterygium wilfordii]